jgi:hypothetical protein
MKTTPKGFITMKVSDETLEEVLEWRKEQNGFHGGDIFPGDFDKRAAGRIGELGVKHWLKKRGAEFTHRESPDFLIYGLTVEVKTFSRRGWRITMKTGQNIPVEQIDDAGLSVFFCSYDSDHQELTLCGGIGRKEFKRVAWVLEEGEIAPDKFECKHACYRAPQKHLWTPDRWLEGVRDIDIWIRSLEARA